MPHQKHYEIFIICPDCDYRQHYFSDQKIVNPGCPKCGRQFGTGDLPTMGRMYRTKKEMERVNWLRNNYEKADRLNLGPDIGVIVVTHEL